MKQAQKAVLHTEGSERRYAEFIPETKKVYENIYKYLNGKTAYVDDWFEGDGSYALIGLVNDNENKEFWWLAEQDPFVGTYDSRTEFDKDWDNDEYTGPDGCFRLCKEEVELVVE